MLLQFSHTHMQGKVHEHAPCLSLAEHFMPSLNVGSHTVVIHIGRSESAVMAVVLVVATATMASFSCFITLAGLRE